MKLNFWMENLSPAEARRLVALIAEFEETLEKHLDVTVAPQPEAPKPVEPKAEAKAETEQVIEKAKRGRPAKNQGGSALNRDQLINKLRGAVQSDYEACEAYLLKIGKESFLTLSDTELAAACLELVK
jgi:hypothetical protein